MPDSTQNSDKGEVGQDQGDRPMAADLVVAYVRQLLEGGELNPGDRLPPEREMASLIGVSRPSVRAGLQTLAAVGVVVSRRGSGTFVTEGPPLLDTNPLPLFAALHGIGEDKLYEARRVFEIDLAGLAAMNATDEHLVMISEEIMEMFMARDNPKKYLIHDIRFHRAVAQASQNPLLAALLEMVAELFYVRRKETIVRWKGANQATDHHRLIYSAIRARDPNRARAEMEKHLRWAEEIHKREALECSPPPESEAPVHPSDEE